MPKAQKRAKMGFNKLEKSLKELIGKELSAENLASLEKELKEIKINLASKEEKIAGLDKQLEPFLIEKATKELKSAYEKKGGLIENWDKFLDAGGNEENIENKIKTFDLDITSNKNSRKIDIADEQIGDQKENQPSQEDGGSLII